jgi:hypothetical protein
MKLNRFASVLVAVVLSAPAVFAAEDLTGKWSGSFVITMDGGDPREDVAHLVVTKHAGTEFTGSVGPNPDQQWPILKAKVDTVKAEGKEVTKLSFDVQAEGGAGPMIHFELELVAGHLKGKAGAEADGRTMSALVDLTRVK